MAVTATANQTRQGFCVNAYSADASGCEAIQAAVTGKKIKLDRLAINSGATITVTVGAGETTGAVTTVIAGPFYTIAGTNINLEFNPPVELAASTALTFDTSGAGAICIVAQGKIE
jgi:hypothetical protein